MKNLQVISESLSPKIRNSTNMFAITISIQLCTRQIDEWNRIENSDRLAIYGQLISVTMPRQLYREKIDFSTNNVGTI